MPSHVLRENMEQKTKPPKINVGQINIPELDMDDLKKHSHLLVSPTVQGGARKSTNGGKGNCLCSPTTHAGSFRCRHHRATTGMHRGRSVGSNLAALGSKEGSISDSL